MSDTLALPEGAGGLGSFQQRFITVSITLGVGTFGQTGQNTVTLAGGVLNQVKVKGVGGVPVAEPLRIEATIRKAGAPSMDSAEVRLYGVEPSVMNATSTLGITPPMVRPHNILTLGAGDSLSGIQQVFQGYILYCYQNFNEMPETMLQFVCNCGADVAVIPTVPTSFPVVADVATIMSGLADRMGYNFQNDGVQVQLASPYFAGTALQQVQKCAQAAHINYYIDSRTAPPTLVIWPWTKTRGGVVPLISEESGMIGYPNFYSNGLEFSCLFNPNIRVGGQIEMRSSIGAAVTYKNPKHPTPDTRLSGGPNGLWMVNSLTHELTSQIPDGPWTTEATCVSQLSPSPS